MTSKIAQAFNEFLNSSTSMDGFPESAGAHPIASSPYIKSSDAPVDEPDPIFPLAFCDPKEKFAEEFHERKALKKASKLAGDKFTKDTGLCPKDVCKRKQWDTEAAHQFKFLAKLTRGALVHVRSEMVAEDKQQLAWTKDLARKAEASVSTPNQLSDDISDSDFLDNLGKHLGFQEYRKLKVEDEACAEVDRRFEEDRATVLALEKADALLASTTPAALAQQAEVRQTNDEAAAALLIQELVHDETVEMLAKAESIQDEIRQADAKSLAAAKASDRVRTKFDDVMQKSLDMQSRVREVESRIIPTNEEYRISKDPMGEMADLLKSAHEPEKVIQPSIREVKASTLNSRLNSNAF